MFFYVKESFCVPPTNSCGHIYNVVKIQPRTMTEPDYYYYTHRT